MTALEAYILACKKAAGALSGVQSMAVDEQTLVITCKDGTVLRMSFPTPKDAPTITKAEFNEDKELVFTLSDLTEINAGTLPGGSGGEGSGVLEADLTTNVTVGDCTSGTKFTAGTSLEDILRKILIQEVAPTVKITLNPIAGTFLKGTTKELKYIIASCTKGSATLVKLEIYANLDKIAEQNCGTSSSYTITFTDPIEYTDTTDFYALLTYKTSEGVARSVRSPSVSYNFTYYTIFGAVSSLDDLTSDGLNALTKKVVGSKGYSATYTCDNKYLCYAIPASFGKIKSIKNDLFDLTWASKQVEITDSYGNITVYDVYYNTNPCEVSGYAVHFA